MDADTGVTFSVSDTIGALDRAAWDSLAPPGANPFLSWAFLTSLEDSACVGAGSGWEGRHILAHDSAGGLVGALPLFRKAHSYGEYVFDHAWADALHRAGGRYYPKLQAAAPFSPVTGSRLLTSDPAIARGLIAAAIGLAKQSRASSVHVTFCTAAEQQLLTDCGLMARTGVQFHWDNARYADFAAFLSALSASKRKTIRRERERALEAGVTIRTLEGEAVTKAAWDHFFACYMDTGGRKWGQPYLNRKFFSLLHERMGERLVLFEAQRGGRPIAAALNIRGDDTLYGRYWGRLEDVPFLHFELCYYQAVDYAIVHGLQRVEAGAQGEHKLLRGYGPVATHSAHWIAHPGLARAVADFLGQERPAIAEEIELLDQHTPFKKLETDL
jgi:uncharacterized protein